MILPVTDNLGGALGFKVFEKLEDHLKDSRWCYYKSNSQILGILQNYREDLRNQLENPEVIKTVAAKVRSGSIIKTDLQHSSKGTMVELKILGENGKDLYFKEKTSLTNSDPSVISATITNWLEVYAKTIPYDGQITGILGTQFTIDVGKASLVRVGDAVDIVRPLQKKTHPLLKEIVAWNTELLAHGKVFNVSEFQAQGKVTEVVTRKNLKKGDWVRRRKRVALNNEFEKKYNKVKKEEFGKLGQVHLHTELGTGSAKSIISGDSKEIGGFVFGFNLYGELWATRNYFAGIGFGRRFSKYKTKTGTLSQDTNSVTSGSTKIVVGYKYLPMGFFYGPQVDGYVGYGSHNYNMDTATADGFAEVDFKGLLMGVKGDIPLSRKYRIFSRLEWMPSPGYSESVNLYGESDSESSFMFQVGGNYLYAPNLHFEGVLELLSDKAKFVSTNQLSFSSTILKIGAVFTY